MNNVVGLVRSHSAGRPLAIGSTSRASLSGGTKKPVSTMPSGLKMRLSKNRSSGWPETISTMRPSTSTPWLYSQASPG